MEKTNKGNVDKTLGTITATAAVIIATVGVSNMIRSDIKYDNSIKSQQANSVSKIPRTLASIEERAIHTEGNFSVSMLCASSLLLLSSLYSFRLAKAAEIEENKEARKRLRKQIEKSLEMGEKFDLC